MKKLRPREEHMRLHQKPVPHSILQISKQRLSDQREEDMGTLLSNFNLKDQICMWVSWSNGLGLPPSLVTSHISVTLSG